MKRAIKTIGLIVPLVIGMLFAVFTSCEKINNAGVVTVKMVDHPGIDASRYEQVNLDIKEVQFNYIAGPQNRPGWIGVKTLAGVYNILKFRDGVSLTLVSRQRIPVGKANAIRIVLGGNNTVKINGRTYPLMIDPAHRDGIAQGIVLQVRPNYKIDIMLGLDGTSIATDGAGKFRLKPVLTVLRNQSNPQ